MIYYESSDRFVISEWRIGHRLLHFTTNHRPGPGIVNHVLQFSLADYVDTIYRLHGILVEDATTSEVAELKTRFVLRYTPTDQEEAKNVTGLVSVPAKDVRDEYRYFALRTQGRSYYVIARGFVHKVHTADPFTPLMKLKPFLVTDDPANKR